MFLTPSEQQLEDEYLTQGYIIRPAADLEALAWMRSQFIRLIADALEVDANGRPEDILNQIHQKVPVAEINTFRLKIIGSFNAIEQFREMYFRVARPYLESLVGNELAMQLRVNLSIQFPGDDSSLLPVHADTWSGDSPFEVVVWLPLVDCYRSKAMYILPPVAAAELSQQFVERAGNNSEDLFQSIRDEVKWLDVRYGEVLIFDQALPHGNRVNEEPETRWSMNCRFKGVFTPYGDKKIGEFFEPITLRAASKAGMAYRLPKLS
ncbi:MAG TPA: 2OG-Fe(II) oxygenase [Rhodospirillales bacterium]|nr:2OG-Fe(II) oxygenase [Rhodospirillales bacterium]